MLACVSCPALHLSEVLQGQRASSDVSVVHRVKQRHENNSSAPGVIVFLCTCSPVQKGDFEVFKSKAFSVASKKDQFKNK